MSVGQRLQGYEGLRPLRYDPRYRDVARAGRKAMPMANRVVIRRRITRAITIWVAGPVSMLDLNLDRIRALQSLCRMCGATRPQDEHQHQSADHRNEASHHTAITGRGAVWKAEQGAVHTLDGSAIGRRRTKSGCSAYGHVWTSSLPKAQLTAGGGGKRNNCFLVEITEYRKSVSFEAMQF